MRIFKYGKVFEFLYPNRLWSIKTQEKIIYLTFDDGPVPEATLYVLAELKKVNAQATFFMVGDNVRKYPEVYQNVINQGHRVGNHTMNHLNGKNCLKNEYLENIQACEAMLGDDNIPSLFRPPYGKMKQKQANAIDAQIVMWSVLTYDFDKTLSAEDCLSKAIKFTKKGSIVLMHDSIKTINKLKYVLPKYLDYFTKEGYVFKCL